MSRNTILKLIGIIIIIGSFLMMPFLEPTFTVGKKKDYKNTLALGKVTVDYDPAVDELWVYVSVTNVSEETVDELTVEITMYNTSTNSTFIIHDTSFDLNLEFNESKVFSLLAYGVYDAEYKSIEFTSDDIVYDVIDEDDIEYKVFPTVIFLFVGIILGGTILSMGITKRQKFTPTDTIICPTCNSSTPRESNICYVCGNKIKKEE